MKKKNEKLWVLTFHVVLLGHNVDHIIEDDLVLLGEVAELLRHRFVSGGGVFVLQLTFGAGVGVGRRRAACCMGARGCGSV